MITVCADGKPRIDPLIIFRGTGKGREFVSKYGAGSGLTRDTFRSGGHRRENKGTGAHTPPLKYRARQWFPRPAISPDKRDLTEDGRSVCSYLLADVGREERGEKGGGG